MARRACAGAVSSLSLSQPDSLNQLAPAVFNPSPLHRLFHPPPLLFFSPLLELARSDLSP